MNKNFVFYLSILLSLISISLSYAQNDSSYVRTDKPENGKEEREDGFTPLKEKIYIGLYPGFSWSNYASSYEISPLVGLDIIPKLSVGLGMVYKSSSSKGYYTTTGTVDPYKAGIFGGRAFAFYNVYQSFCAYTEYEGVTINIKRDYDPDVKIWKPAFNAGILYKSEIGNKFSANLLVLYNLLYREDAFFRESPLDIRIGFLYYPFR